MPTASASPSSAVVPTPSDWTRRIDPSFIDPLGMTSIEEMVAGPRGLVAAGAGPPGAAVWRSADGIRWSRVPDVPAFHAGPIYRLVADKSGYVAYNGRLLASADGIHWSSHKPPAAGYTLTALGLDHGRLIAFGELSEGDVVTRAWISKDRGATWKRAKGSFGLGDEVFAISTLPDGRLLAVGTSQEGQGAWTSADGASWAKASSGFGPGPGASPDDLPPSWNAIAVDAAGRIVVVGSEADNPAVVTSMDGLSWTRSIVPGGPEQGMGLIDAVIATKQGFVVPGAVPTSVVGVWRSLDGMSWEPEPLVDVVRGDAGTFQPTSVAEVDDRIVVAGQYPRPEGAGGQWSAATWVSPAAGVASYEEPVACPRDSSLVAIANTPASRRAGCFGGRTLTVTGYLADIGDCGDVCVIDYFPISPGRGEGFLRLEIYPNKAHGGDPRHWNELVGHRVRVSGRIDDPSAKSCTSEQVGASTQSDAVATCASRFVALHVTDLGVR